MNMAWFHPLLAEICNYKMMQPSSLFARNFHWTGEVTLKYGKGRWATAWNCMNPDCNWDDISWVKSASNFLQCREQGCIISRVPSGPNEISLFTGYIYIMTDAYRWITSTYKWYRICPPCRTLQQPSPMSPLLSTYLLYEIIVQTWT